MSFLKHGIWNWMCCFHLTSESVCFTVTKQFLLPLMQKFTTTLQQIETSCSKYTLLWSWNSLSFFFCPDFFLSTLLNFNSSNNHLSLAPNRQSNAYFLKRDHNSQSINLGDPTFSNTVHLKASKTLKRAKLCYQRSSSFLKY